VFRGRKINQTYTTPNVEWFKIDVKGARPETYIEFSKKTTSVYLFRASDKESDVRIIVGIDMFDNRELSETINSHIAVMLANATKALKTAYQQTTGAPK
jgi:hypothetical protein